MEEAQPLAKLDKAEPVLCSRWQSDARVADPKQELAALLAGADLDPTALGLWFDAVADCILHRWLEQ
jgi:hypothetical protein